MSQQQALFVEQPTENDWEVDEHLFCCTKTRSICNLRFCEHDTEFTESFGQDQIMCRLCWAIHEGDDVTWRCPACGCGIDEDCGKHL